MERLRLLFAPDRLRALWRIVTMRASSSLVRRIAVLNLAGLVALLIGFFVLKPISRGPDRCPRAIHADTGRNYRRCHFSLGHARDQ